MSYPARRTSLLICGKREKRIRRGRKGKREGTIDFRFFKRMRKEGSREKGGRKEGEKRERGREKTFMASSWLPHPEWIGREEIEGRSQEGGMGERQKKKGKRRALNPTSFPISAYRTGGKLREGARRGGGEEGGRGT